jgi:hypothetical protein
MMMPAMAVWLMAALPAGAAIVDRVAITVGNKVITESAIDLRIRLTALENGVKADFSLSSRREAAQRLVDQKLVEREMDVGHYPHGVPDSGKKSPAPAALEAYGLTPEDLASDLEWQSQLLTFVSLRFRPAVQVTDQDVEKYFRDQSLNGELNDVRAQIEQKLTNERADQELDRWLQDQRKHTRIEYLDKNLQPPEAEESAK